MTLTREQKLEMIQLGYRPLNPEDVQRYLNGRKPVEEKIQVENLGQSNMRDDFPDEDTSGEMQKLNEGYVETPVFSPAIQKKQNQRMQYEDDEFGLGPAKVNTEPSQNQYLKLGEKHATESLRLFVQMLQMNSFDSRKKYFSSIENILKNEIALSKKNQTYLKEYQTGLKNIGNRFLNRL